MGVCMCLCVYVCVCMCVHNYAGAKADYASPNLPPLPPTSSFERHLANSWYAFHLTFSYLPPLPTILFSASVFILLLSVYLLLSLPDEDKVSEALALHIW